MTKIISKQKLSDEEILERLKSSPPDSKSLFELLYSRYHSKVRNYFLSQKVLEKDAEDLEQNVFIQLFKKRARYRNGTPAPAWIFIIAKTVFLEYHRREKKYDQLKSSLKDSPPNSYSYEGVKSFCEDSLSLEGLNLESFLSQEEMEILHDRFVYGLSFKELEKKWGGATSLWRKRVSRIYQKLREQYKFSPNKKRV
ncbi:MAG: sigma-70 family RNA polymerase sigma factor [Bdellovibrionaceae bacterium]|nr:sigma-70 family RNA polymerase sigma factor [Pseudobdellovibrionaceae bacterium]MDW8190510.1 sigma-70 family RNA polymerase sigma factor [Pseudobdellovibrionaceae bacterium]